ncbi:MAG: DNA internalization-related competence protein ComEC/Rec2, partial [Halofilum sp. (in: g-proteobacteria)]|nr:DNA internalization-related competence protein ComEC/Rec2 [Halofilum sp. (in: g-proteobacteria)]
MAWIALALTAGAATLFALPALPPAWLAALLFLPACALLLAGPCLRPAGACLLGFALAALAAHARLEHTLAPGLAGADLRIEGRIDGLPQDDGRRLRFEFLVRSGSRDGHPVRLPRRVRLSWYGPGRAQPVPGERWRLTVRLRSPRGFANPGGFDYGRWLFRHGIGATGYVRDAPGPVRLAPARPSIDALRAGLRARLAPVLEQLEHPGMLRALTLGDRGGIPAGRWRTLVATGTNHLMAISGLHVGLVALLGYGLGRGLWRVGGPLRRRLPRPMLQALTALALAALYAALAGFALPTVRALTMLALALGAVCMRRRVRPGSVLAGAAVTVIAFDPLAVLAPGFWLSFGAVAAILWVCAGRLGRPRRLGGWLRLQCAIALALTPLLLALFREASLVAPLANALAVPWVSIATVPSALGGAALWPLWPALGAGLLWLADTSLLVIWWLLERLAGLSFAQWRAPAHPHWMLALALVGAAVLLLPRGVPGKPAALLAVLPLLLWQPPRPASGAFWVDVLDVGQGLAVVVRTARHTLVYDTGARFSPRFDAGSAVVVPFVRSVGVRRLDALVVSHGDDDHAGGADAVTRELRPRRIWTSVPARLHPAAGFCARGLGWRWDRVRFRFLHPARDGVWRGNNASCVLRVDGPGGSLLLPGDIEAGAERALVAGGAALAADVVVAPHHGSATSSTPGFVAAVNPRWVLYSVGHGNRWGFPRPQVLAAWRPAGWARTDCGGALHLAFDPGHGVA